MSAYHAAWTILVIHHHGFPSRLPASFQHRFEALPGQAVRAFVPDAGYIQDRLKKIIMAHHLITDSSC
ncbi:hypothetical protein SDC9_205775 [bioreactor metagenome]|uniref:Uncharacterized protein n=1 Tax=bioreactor metagenome TaxID=1076179 RepID=A0A645JCE7_9ZZZZ